MYRKLIIKKFNGFDVGDLFYHLSMNGYDFGLDTVRAYLFVLEDQVDYVETILKEHKVEYVA